MIKRKDFALPDALFSLPGRTEEFYFKGFINSSQGDIIIYVRVGELAKGLLMSPLHCNFIGLQPG